MVLGVQHRRFSVTELEKMVASDLFAEEERVELVDGQLVAMTPPGPRHAGTVAHVAQLLFREVGDSAVVNVQNPIVLDEWTLPIPDVTVLAPRTDFYRSAYPTPTDVLLLVEVADSSVDYDTNVKLPRYAAGGIHEVWIVNLRARRLECYREPTESLYAEATLLGSGDVVALAAFPGISFDVDAILGVRPDV